MPFSYIFKRKKERQLAPPTASNSCNDGWIALYQAALNEDEAVGWRLLGHKEDVDSKDSIGY
jgi:hypothetical protein